MSQIKSINQVVPGEVLTTSIYDADSKLLLREGVRLDEMMLGLIKRSGREYVDIATKAPCTLSQCKVCQSAISLQLPTASFSVAATWVCRECDSIYFGMARSSTLAPVDVMLKPMRSVSLPPHIDLIFKQSWRPNEKGSENRAHERQIVTLPITVVPLDESFRVVGESIELETQDISPGGVCLKHVENLDCSNLYLEFPIQGQRVRRIAEIVRTRKHGEAFEIGCKFLCPVEEHSMELKPICSVSDCRKVAVCKVFRQDFDIAGGEPICDPDDSCPYLCREHLTENEQQAKGIRNLRGLVTYPHTNKLKLKGVSIYMPLKQK